METTNTDRRLYQAWAGTEFFLFSFVEYLFTISKKRVRVKIVGIGENHVLSYMPVFLYEIIIEME
jgi:hypothetical protein